ncbi:PREDICTED: CD48 antigen isoform X2 [Chinchilla lanigera]|uniref:CD48 molecule n=1 Tax=Chinchilla lanigera TaxID=34839 RepID=A0A8C2W3Y1_CHILA|nr:PREDICTED: CD48 antigen isoform X2 [Chinchilla lanigera]
MCSRKWEWCSALELLLLPFLVTGIPDHSEKITSVSGNNVTLQSSKKLLGNYTHSTWFYTTNQKIVEWDSSDVNYFNTRFKHRVRLDPRSTALHIYNVQKEDSSTYLLRVSNEGGSEYEINIILEVFDPVPEFLIELKEVKKVGDNCYLNLSCEIQNQSVDYVWYTDSGIFPNGHKRSVLEVNLTSSHKQSTFYTCQVSNPVSSQNDTVYFRPPCTLVRSSGVMNIINWLVTLIPIIPVLLLT